MKAVILAGGLGTRISEESVLRPKPLIEIGGKPILWHIMKTYAAYGVNEFVICCGYKGHMVKDFFLNYYLHQSDITVDLKTNETHLQRLVAEPWKVTLADTGETTMTGGRLKRIHDYVKDEEFFFFTYGDGVANIDVGAQIAHHKAHGKLATITAVQPPGRYGALDLDGDSVRDFVEKPRGDGGWINGGFFVLSPKVIEHIDGDETSWEDDPLRRLAHDDQLNAYFHKGFWQPMDTMRDKNHLEELWNTGNAPWKT